MDATETLVWVYEVEIVDAFTMATLGFFPEFYNTLTEARAAIMAERSHNPRLIRKIRATKLEVQS